MALIYSLDIKEDIPLHHIVEKYLLEKNIFYSVDMKEEVTEIDTYKSLGFNMFASNKADEKYFDFIYNNSDYKFEWRSTRSLRFRLDKFYDNNQAKLNLLSIVICILQNTIEDALFQFNSDVLILKREKAIIYYNKSSGFWESNDLLEILKLNFEVH